jgi:hypothetical protein
MGIRIKNQHHHILTLKASLTLSATTNKDFALVPFAGKISNIYATCSTVGTGNTNSIIDINKNGTTIFSQAPKITISTQSTTVSYSTFTSQPTDVAAGDIISMDIDSVGSGMANLLVSVVITRTGVGAETNVADLDTVF